MNAIDGLSPQQIEELYAWLDQRHPQPIDVELTTDLGAGRMDDRINRALFDHKARNTRTPLRDPRNVVSFARTRCLEPAIISTLKQAEKMDALLDKKARFVLKHHLRVFIETPALSLQITFWRSDARWGASVSGREESAWGA